MDHAYYGIEYHSPNQTSITLCIWKHAFKFSTPNRLETIRLHFVTQKQKRNHFECQNQVLQTKTQKC